MPEMPQSWRRRTHEEVPSKTPVAATVPTSDHDATTATVTEDTPATVTGAAVAAAPVPPSDSATISDRGPGG